MPALVSKNKQSRELPDHTSMVMVISAITQIHPEDCYRILASLQLVADFCGEDETELFSYPNAFKVTPTIKPDAQAVASAVIRWAEFSAPGVLSNIENGGEKKKA